MAATGRRGRKFLGEINVVPYIDVMLVLLIIFMVTAPLLTQGVQVNLPKVGATPLPDIKHEPLIVSIDRSGRLYVNVGDAKDQAINEATLATRVRAVLGRDAETPVLLKADETVPYGRVMKTMVLLQQSGAARVGFLTDPLGQPPRASSR